MTARGERGFLSIETIIFVLVVGLVVLAAFVLFFKQNKSNTTAPADAPIGQTQEHTTAEPQLKRWPVAINDFNLSTQLAGDVYMHDDALISEGSGESELPVTEFGRERGKKGITTSIDFLTRHGAVAYSASDGYVLGVEQAAINGQQEFRVQVAPARARTTQWLVVYTHLTDIRIKAGDTLTAGQRIGAAAPYDSSRPFSQIGLQVLRYGVSNATGTAEAHCPSRFMTRDAKQQMTADFLLLTKAWEEQSANGGAYNEPAWTRLGCAADTLKL